MCKLAVKGSRISRKKKLKGKKNQIRIPYSQTMNLVYNTDKNKERTFILLLQKPTHVNN